jgi:hypothetical protein
MARYSPDILGAAAAVALILVMMAITKRVAKPREGYIRAGGFVIAGAVGVYVTYIVQDAILRGWSWDGAATSIGHRWQQGAVLLATIPFVCLLVYFAESTARKDR